MDRFVVGTGRCGSTLLSRMLGECTSIASFSEFFNGLDLERRFADPLSGEQLAELVSAEQPFVTAVLRRGYPVDEVTYPFESPKARYRIDQALPWLLVATLPPLTDDPDRRYLEALDWIRAQPARPPAEQYRALFDWLAEGRGWVERSGSAIDYLDELIDHFPEARFVHLHRDGVEVALSMREHAAYRLAIAFKYADDLDPSSLFGPPVDGDPIEEVLRGPRDPSPFGLFWHDQMQRGCDAMEALGSDQLLHVGFDELLAAPRPTLERIADFFELPQGDWLDRAAARVERRDERRIDALPAERADALRQICQPAEARLASLRS